MRRVWIRDKRSGREKLVAPRYANVLVNLKKAEYVVEEAEAPFAPPTPAPSMPAPAAAEDDAMEESDGEDEADLDDESQEEPPVEPDYSAMSYTDLQRLVKERELETDGRSKEALVRALTAASGRYGRRDMRAQD